MSAGLPSGARPPGNEPPLRATYRVQLTPELGFAELRERLPYLAALGVSHVYVSPCLEAVRGSTHGYDVTDPTRIRQELGGERECEALFAACRQLGLGVVMDIVPNHMAASAEHNPWWRDLLRWGAASRYAHYFDVDWARHAGRVLLPILGTGRGAGVARGEVRLELSGSELELLVEDERLPLSARSLPRVFGDLADADLGERLARLGALVQVGAVRSLIEGAERSVLEWVRATPEHELRAREAVAAVNTDAERREELLEAQFYRLRNWRAGLDELNYRRFFDVSSLCALRVEDREVFDAVHVQIRRWLSSGALSAVRVDHPDGLQDPGQYLERLRDLLQGRWLFVEKILQHGERLPESWPVDGTTGYEFASIATRLFVDSSAEAKLTATYCRRAELPGYDFSHLAHAAKARALRELFGAEVAALTARALPVCQTERGPSGAGDVRRALLGLLSGLPVYRTYLRPGRPASESDRSQLEVASRHAISEAPELAGLVRRIVELLLGTPDTPRNDALASAFQQLSGPAMAKGLEDTVFYDDARLIALNEVGNDPARFGASVEELHAHCLEVAASRPRTLLATSTHDTKRSEDVRLRIALLSEIPDEWDRESEAWMARARALPGGSSVDPRTLYFLLQTLVGAYPISGVRLSGYLLKAVREAKAWTSWLSPDLPREATFASFVAALLEDAAFQARLRAFVSRLEPAFVRHALALTLLKLTAPGVPDIYQGTELWDQSLADPDNRRPVDYELRERLLRRVGSGPLERGAVAPFPDGHGGEKLWLIRRVLELRRQRPECFDARGTYTPLDVEGVERQRVVAFQRGTGVVVVAPRLTLSLTRGWRGTSVALPAGRFIDVLTGEPAVSGRIEDLVARFPVALLARD